jgi:hypothetical protein
VDEVRDNSLPDADQSEVEGLTLAGEPSPVKRSTTAKRLIGCMKGKMVVPNDIKTMFADEIEEMFYGDRAQHKFEDIDETVD